MSDEAAPARFDEGLYRESVQQLRSPRPLPVTSIVFVVLMLVFVIGVFTDLKSVSGVLVLVAVVAFHEAGHALGMRIFAFRDVRMFFIPFFGAAVSGRPRGAAAWKEAIVTLLGPLPGIAAGIALLFWAGTRQYPDALSFRVIEALLVLNVFNLLPFGFLDGGRFLERVLFSRHRVLEVAFVALGSIALGALALWGHMYLLALFALMSLGGLPRRWRTLGAAVEVRGRHPEILSDPERLTEEQSRTVFSAAQSTLQYPMSEQAGSVAEGMEAILGATKRAPGVLATLGLLVLYVAGLLAAFLGIIGLSLHTGPVEWHRYEHAGWSAEFPRPPFAAPATFETGGARDSSWQTIAGGTDRYTITVLEGAGAPAWMDEVGGRLAKTTGLSLAGVRAIDVAGRPGREFEFTAPKRVLHARMLTVGERRFEVTASAPRWGENQRRFLESFAVVDSLPSR
jgi:Zn-dependent protease